MKIKELWTNRKRYFYVGQSYIMRKDLHELAMLPCRGESELDLHFVPLTADNVQSIDNDWESAETIQRIMQREADACDGEIVYVGDQPAGFIMSRLPNGSHWIYSKRNARKFPDVGVYVMYCYVFDQFRGMELSQILNSRVGERYKEAGKYLYFSCVKNNSNACGMFVNKMGCEIVGIRSYCRAIRFFSYVTRIHRKISFEKKK